MAHNINTYVGRQPAWHKLGIVTEKYQTTEDLLANEGFCYEVFKAQLKDHLGRDIEAWGTFRLDHADIGQADKSLFLATVGPDYQVIQHAEGFKMIDALVSSTDGAHYETAGVLGEGERVWALADLGLAAKVGDDVQQGYLLFCTGHDGSLSHQYRMCFTRVVCQNTLGQALSEKTRAKLTVRHTKNAQTKLLQAENALASIQADAKTVEEKLNFIAKRSMTREATESILDRLFPKQKDAEGKERDTTRRSNIIAEVLANFESNDKNSFPEQRGTAYSLLNAITAYTDHSRNADKPEQAMFGSGDGLKSRAFEMILSSAGKLPEVTTTLVYAPMPIPAVAPIGPSSFLDSILDATVN